MNLSKTLLLIILALTAAACQSPAPLMVFDCRIDDALIRPHYIEVVPRTERELALLATANLDAANRQTIAIKEHMKDCQ